MKILIISLFFSFSSYGAPIEVKNKISEWFSFSNDKSVVKKQPKPKRENTNLKKERLSVKNEDIEEVKRIENQNQNELKNYLNKNSIAIWDFTNKFDVKTGTVIKGIILNSIVSSNLDSPILVETVEDYSGIPKGTKFSCNGATKNKRVLAVCNLLITESNEFEVDTVLLNPDGTSGLLGRSYSGKEQYAVGAITAAALKSALDVSLDRMNTSFGTEPVSVTSRNKIKSGGIGALDEIIQMSTDEYKTQEPKISIDAGKEILIYFTRRLKL